MAFLLRLIGQLLARPAAGAATPPISYKAVRKRIAAALQPVLMARGFGRFDGGVARRHCAVWVDVLEILFPDADGGAAPSAGIQLGRYFTFVPPGPGIAQVRRDGARWYPRATEGHIQKVLYRRRASLLRRGSTSWPIDRRGAGLDGCIAHIVQRAGGEILPWFDWLDDPVIVYELFRTGRQDVEGRSRDALLRGTWNHAYPFGRQVVAGMLAARMHDADVCAALLAPVLERGGFTVRHGRVIALSPDALAMVRAACAALPASATPLKN